MTQNDPGALGNVEYPSLLLLVGPLLFGVVAPDKVIFMGQIKLFDIYIEGKQMTYVKLNR